LQLIQFIVIFIVLTKPLNFFMKKAYFLLALVCVSFFSCTKKNSDTANQPKTYIVQGITDITLLPNNSAYMGLTVQYVGPVQEHVALSFEGVPSGILIDSQSNLSGIPTFTSQVTFTDNGSVPRGTYKAKLICNGSVSGQKSYDFSIRVLSCVDEVSGFFTHCTSFCSASGSYTDSVGVDSSTASRIVFSNFSGNGISIYADLACGGSSLTIPAQSVGGKTYTGSGSFALGYINITYSVDSSGFTNYCGFTMSR
jgi:hypothetical protein